MGKGKTIAEKILSRHAGRDVRAGDIAICNIDFCFGQDGTSSIIIDSFRQLKNARPFNKKKFYMVIDHSAPSPNLGVSRIHQKMRRFAKETGVGMYDIGEGVCHQLVPEDGHVVCGDLVLGADSHTCTYGAINVLSTGVGSTDLAIAMASGKSWFKVPDTIKVVLKGRMPKGVYAKDVVLYVIKLFGADGATYKSVEFYGDAIKKMSVDARLTISNMAVEMGAKCGLMEADAKVLSWVKKHSKKRPRPVKADRDANYISVKEIDISKLTPQIAKPHTVDNVVDIGKIKGKRMDQAFLGTCTNGRLEDLRIASGILRGRKIPKDMKFIVAPASKGIFLSAIKEGLIDNFVRSGCTVIAPGCGPCVGTHCGVPADGESTISTANRNFKGRMGNPNSFIYLASPATVAASALEARIADPRKYL